jgi:hypothetical protein
MVCLSVVNDLFLLVFRLVGTIEDLPSCSLENLKVNWDTLSRFHLPRNLQVDFYSWHKSFCFCFVLFRTQQNLNERVS